MFRIVCSAAVSIMYVHALLHKVALLLTVLLNASTPSLIMSWLTVCVPQGKAVGSESKEKFE
jgi:hypothetical protein